MQLEQRNACPAGEKEGVVFDDSDAAEARMRQMTPQKRKNALLKRSSVCKLNDKLFARQAIDAYTFANELTARQFQDLIKVVVVRTSSSL